jgi:DNA-binding LacI/PurR family transcriptional regulator
MARGERRSGPTGTRASDGGRVKIDDVAREAGVSIATVSRFMNGQAGSMSDDTRARLAGVVERLGYSPNPMAQALKTGRSRLLGVIVADIAHPYWSSVLAGVEEAASEAGYSVLISSAANDLALERNYLRTFIDYRVEGLLINPTSAVEHPEDPYRRLPCPAIALDRTFPDLDYDLFSVDNIAGVRLAVDHLVALGHRNIAFLGWEIRNLSNRQERLDGFLQAMAAHGLAVPPDNVMLVSEAWGEGEPVVAARFGRPYPPSAVVCGSSSLNLQALAGLRRIGLRCPHDVSIVGFDQSQWDELLDPPLTTIATAAHELGKRAVEHLVRRIEDPRGTRQPVTYLSPHLVVRESTRALPAPLS